jgi:uncharacterized phage protein (TIGR02218 family)
MSRVIPAAILSAATAGGTTLARCWEVTRADGAVFRWTDHDRALTVDGDAYTPVNALDATDAESTLDLSASNFGAAGAFDAAAIMAADVEAGLWDGAAVNALWVDWSDPTRFWRDFTGRLGEMTRSEHGFSVDVISITEDALVPRGRTHGRLCDAVLGDARCAKDVTTATFRGVATVVASKTRTLLTASGVGAFASGWFEGGAALWLTGANAGQAHEVRLFVTGTIAKLQLWTAPRVTPVAGETLRLTAGCDKRFATCKAKFANAANFRGFPHMPGDAAVIQTTDAREPLDGSGRNVGRD